MSESTSRDPTLQQLDEQNKLRKIARLRAQLAVLATMYDHLRQEFCPRCTAAICSEHQPADGLVEVTGRRFDGAFPDWPLPPELQQD